MAENQSKTTISITADNKISSSEPKVLMTQREAAQYLGTSVGVLNVWRHLGKQKIPFVRWGRHIRYRKADLDAWIDSNVENKGA